jgi:hypothetical protein
MIRLRRCAFIHLKGLRKNRIYLLSFYLSGYEKNTLVRIREINKIQKFSWKYKLVQISIQLF